MGTAIWSPEALADIDYIWRHYEGVAGRSVAEKLVREIGKKVALIEGYPLAGRSRDELRPGIRSLAASPHVIFYRLSSDNPEIVRVLDGRQDIEAIFTAR
jgi:toxin ParE1/3/4